MLAILKYSSELLAHAAGVDVMVDGASPSKQGKNAAFWDVKFTDLLSLTANNDTSTKLLVCNMLMTVQTLMSSQSFALLLKASKGAQKSLLEVWEKLQTLLGATTDASGGDEDAMEDEEGEGEFDFFAAATEAVVESLCSLQRLLDVPNFLTTTKCVVCWDWVGRGK